VCENKLPQRTCWNGQVGAGEHFCPFALFLGSNVACGSSSRRVEMDFPLTFDRFLAQAKQRPIGCPHHEVFATSAASIRMPALKLLPHEPSSFEAMHPQNPDAPANESCENLLDTVGEAVMDAAVSALTRSLKSFSVDASRLPHATSAAPDLVQAFDTAAAADKFLPVIERFALSMPAPALRSAQRCALEKLTGVVFVMDSPTHASRTIAVLRPPIDERVRRSSHSIAVSASSLTAIPRHLSGAPKRSLEGIRLRARRPLCECDCAG